MDLGKHETRSEGGLFTSTSLTDVRRIRFSAGAADRSRSPGCLSGLWLQFRNGGRDNVVGQWFGEVDVMDIDDGDYVTHIRVWYTQEAKMNNTLRVNNGKMVGVMLSTFNGACKTVLCSGPDGMLCHDYYSNPWEQIVSLPDAP
ncbi:hypothetical protein IMZ48_18305 [Candidatus Bathyarchaeota archaeon]|nr:hypothetical protein [Candidatus Bathyarchaeota archaeon]